MTSINPYLTFNGNCEEAFNFYKANFGGEFNMISYFGEMPPQEGMPAMSEEEKKRVMHVGLQISKETVLMGSDTGGEWSDGFKQGTNISISINTDTKEKADKLFAGLSAGGQVTMPMENTFWGSYFGMCTDKFGIQWMMSVEVESK